MKCLNAIESNIEKMGSSIAIVDGRESITYSELGDSVFKIQQLVNNSKCSDYVGVFINRSSRYIISSLAIQFSDKAFVPINPSLPDNRIISILKAADVNYIITDSSNATRLTNLKQFCEFNFLILDDSLEESTITDMPNTQPESENAYCLFTSGTTGDPKGVVVTKKNLESFFVE